MKKLNILVIAVSLICSISVAQATIDANASTTKPSRLYLLKGEVQAGTLIPSVDATSSVPFNKRFNALTREQQNLVRAKFHNLGINDTPPFPLSGLRAVYKPLIKANKTYGDNAALTVIATINSSGSVNSVTVHNSSNSALVSYIERTLQRTKFEPAQCNGVACDMDFPIDISFN